MPINITLPQLADRLGESVGRLREYYCRGYIKATNPRPGVGNRLEFEQTEAEKLEIMLHLVDFGFTRDGAHRLIRSQQARRWLQRELLLLNLAEMGARGGDQPKS